MRHLDETQSNIKRLFNALTEKQRQEFLNDIENSIYDYYRNAKLSTK